MYCGGYAAVTTAEWDQCGELSWYFFCFEAENLSLKNSRLGRSLKKRTVSDFEKNRVPVSEKISLVPAFERKTNLTFSTPPQVLYYSTDFFTRAGLPSSQAKFASIGVGAIMVGMTLVSIMLIDRAGRRTLHLWGLGGMFVFSLFITIAMLCKVS